MEDSVKIDEGGHLVRPTSGTLPKEILLDAATVLGAGWDTAGATGVDASHSTTTVSGALVTGEPYDLIRYDMVAGQTYTFAYRSLDGSLEDPLLRLYKLNGSTLNYVIEDDDGGAGRSALLTFTPTQTGTYYLFAASWVPGDTGNYTIDVWKPGDGPEVPGTIDSTETLNVGTNFGYLDAAGDKDVYRIDAVAGNVYTFTYAGGIGTNGADWSNPTRPGDSIGVLELLDSAGNVVSTAVNYETRLQFVAEENETYYLRVSGYESTMTGGYTIDSEVKPFTAYDPLQALNWDSAANVPFADTDGDGVGDTAYIYFAVPGQNFGMLQGETGSTEQLLSFGFSPLEQERILAALNNEYGQLLGINYVATTEVSQATFRLILTEDEPYGARFLNYSPSYGANQGVGVFVRDNAGWSYDQQQSLLEGGYDYSLILHEFGHAHGIAHPHDTGGGSEIMLGVTGSQGSLGLFDLNQGVYTVMSYNDAWQLNPAGPSPLTGAAVDNGWVGSLSALDIAILQARYGLADHNDGDTVYTLTDVVDDAFYETIWDTSGTDTIAYNGNLDARIDLTAATLDYSPTGGGVISFLLNDPDNMPTNSFRVRGGFTIANGVVIENATGGAGDDVLIGNAADNVITGNKGNDTMIGRDGIDTVSYANATGSVNVNLGAGTATGADGSDTFETIENAIGSGFGDRLIGDAGVNHIAGGNGLDVVTLGGGDDCYVVGLETTTTKLKTGKMSVDIITDFDASGAGNDLIDLSGLSGDYHFDGTSANKDVGDVTYKMYTSINGAENALGFDIDGQSGAGGVSGPVTVVYINHDGGAPDEAIILLNTSSVDANDFIF